MSGCYVHKMLYHKKKKNKVGAILSVIIPVHMHFLTQIKGQGRGRRGERKENI